MSTETPHRSRSTIVFSALVKSIWNASGSSLSRTVNTNSLQCSTNVCKNLIIHHSNECSLHGERLLRFSPFIFFFVPPRVGPRTCQRTLEYVLTHSLHLLWVLFAAVIRLAYKIRAYAVHGICLCVWARVCMYASLCLPSSETLSTAVHWCCRH